MAVEMMEDGDSVSLKKLMEEKFHTISSSIESIGRDVDRGTISLDYPTQRSEGQWEKQVITHASSDVARIVKRIANSDWFEDNGKYTPSSRNNGTINRIVMESIMVINYLDEWKKKPEDMGIFLKTKNDKKCFYHFEEILKELDGVVESESVISNMFDPKNSFVLFALFDKFKKLGLESVHFVKFLSAFQCSLHEHSIEGVTWGMLNKKSPKDKAIVMGKINYLEVLMMDYLGLEHQTRS